MKRLLLTMLIGSFSLCIMHSGCKKKDDTGKLEENGLTKEINNLVPESIINEMKTLGMPINTGENPPSIENIYLASPFILKASNRASDTPGMAFAAYKVKFYDQDNDKLQVKSDYENGGETGTGLGSFIVGSGNMFTTFSEVNSSYSGQNAKLVHVVSGKLVEGGIEGLYFANFMLDNYGNPTGVWIENGEGRVIYDSDGMSEIIDHLKSAPLNTSAADQSAGIVSVR